MKRLTALSFLTLLGLLLALGGAPNAWAQYPSSATGSYSVNTVGNTVIYTFTGNGTFTPTVPLTASLLVVGGGGGGGGKTTTASYYGGGGGAGGLISTTSNLTASVVNPVTVGAGGTAGTSTAAGGNGVNSTFGIFGAIGGGGGGTGYGTGTPYNGLTGGSGGGGARYSGSGTGASGTSGQGNSGSGAASGRGGGGGGSGGAATTTANGGAGTSSSISGSAVTYAGGGGAGGTTAGTATGGGGAGATSSNGTDGTANTGGGGGGGGSATTTAYSGGAGGSGIVIVSYTYYTITASAGANGTISPLGDTAVNANGSQAYTITPNSGYVVYDVVVDGSSVGPTTRYTFTGVTANHTISATFIALSSNSAATGSYTVSQVGSNIIYTFTGNGTFTPSIALAANLLVAGGGGGGGGKTTTASYYGGGGGAGGLISTTSNLTANVANPVTVGGGGNAGTSTAAGGNGGNSAFGTFTATGGGGGGTGYGTGTPYNGLTGGSGGGGARYSGSGTGASGTSGQGNSGSAAASGRGGGGGGSGAAATTTANGGAGTSSSITGSAVTYAGGGGAGGTTAGTGGAGGGGAGVITGNGAAGTANTGGGGGGGGSADTTAYSGGAGGSGIVIVNYTLSFTISASAGANGTISPLGGTTVQYGNSQTYTITANSGYLVNDVVVDGSSVGPTTSYTFTGVTANHTISASFVAVSTFSSATGTPTVSQVGSNVIYTFTGSGSFTPAVGLAANILVVAGGGGGGGTAASSSDYGGGGGAGGYVSTTSNLTASVLNTVTVGGGGSAGSSGTAGGNGVNSAFGNYSATGGGGGGSTATSGSRNGSNGGSGGGGADYTSAGTGGSGTAGQGNSGSAAASGRGGGGGGSGGAATTTANGGAGTASSISGSSVTYAAGGGAAPTGTAGGTGAGAGGSDANGSAATANTGSGGGGGGNTSSTSTARSGGTGGSGIVIVSYTIKATPTVTTWPTPTSAITFGQALSATTLSGGHASVDGSFAFTSPSTVPGAAGIYSASVTFTPTDTTDYNTVTGNVNVTVNPATPTLSVGNSPVTYNGFPQAATVNPSTPGMVSNVKYNGSATVPTAVGTYAITADFAPTDNTDYTSLTGASAGNFVINPGPLDHFTVTTPGTQTAGTPFAITTITALDVYGNTLNTGPNTFAGTVDFTETGGGAGGTVTPSQSSAFSSGVLSGQSVSLSKSGTLVTVTATDHSGSGKTGVSGTFTVNTGAANKLGFTTQPANTVAGVTMANVVVQVQDAGGNPVAQSGTAITLTLNGSTLYSGTNPQTTDGTGKATFNDLVIRQAGTGLTFGAAGGSFSGTSDPFNITAGTAVMLRMETAANGSGSVVGANTIPAGSSVTVYAITRDTYTNFVANPSSTWSLVAMTHGVVSGDLTPTSGASSTITGHLVGTATIHLVNGSFTANSGRQTVVPGAATKLAFTIQPGGGAPGTVWPTEPVVAVQDANGNTVTNDTSTVTVAILSNPSGGTLSGTATKGAVAGVADFSANGLKIDKAGTGYTIRATDGSLTSVTSGAFNIGLLYWQAITIDHTKVPSDQANFPVLVSLTSNAGLSAHAQSSGNDIYFTASDGTTKLSYQREQYSSGTLVAWVKIPTLSHTTDTVIYMYYGNPSATDQQDTTGAVWDSNYQGVWHLSQNPTGTAPQMKDSTSGANNGTAGSAFAAGDQQAAQIDGGLLYHGAVNYDVSVPAANFNYERTSPFTIEYWSKPTGTGKQYPVSKDSNTTPFPGYEVDHNNDLASANTPGAIRLILVNSAVSPYNEIVVAATGTKLNDGSWHHYVYTYDGSSQAAGVKIYQDGVALTLSTGSSNSLTASIQNTTPVHFGSRENAALNNYNGLLDEVRISSAVRSADWIKTGWTNQASPSTFYSVGSENASTTALVSSGSPSLPSVSVTFTATVTGAVGTPTGTVQFKDNGAVLGSPVSLSGGQAQYITSSLSHGNHPITAEYSGGGTFVASVGTVSQTIDTPPTSGTHYLGATVNTPLVVSVGPLANLDVDSDGDMLTITAVTSPSTHGFTVSLASGTITYTPTGGYVGPDQFTYTVSDGYTGGTATSTASVTVALGKATSVMYPPSAPSGTVNLVGYGIPGRVYDVQRSTTADFSSFSVIASALTAPANGVVTYTDSNPNNPSFYRLALH